MHPLRRLDRGAGDDGPRIFPIASSVTEFLEVWARDGRRPSVFCAGCIANKREGGVPEFKTGEGAVADAPHGDGRWYCYSCWEQYYFRYN